MDAPDVCVHVSPLGAMGAEAHTQMLQMLKAHSRFKSVVSIRPTGWTFTRAMDGTTQLSPRCWAENDGTTRLYGVPYSEHSSFDELRMCVRDLRPRKVIATVDGGRDGLNHSGMQLIS